MAEGSNFKAYVTAGYVEGKTIRALAEATGRSYGTVRTTLVAEGIPLRRRGYRRTAAMMAAGDARARREELSSELLRARLARGMTGKSAGFQAGISQSKVSKMETGRLLPKVEDVERLADVYEVDTEMRVRLITLATRVARDAEHRRAVLHRGVSRQQVGVVKVASSASTIRVLGVSGVPRVLVEDISPRKQVIAILTEGALRGSPEAYEDAREAMERHNVDVRVVPFYGEVEVPESGFQIFDARMVVVDLLAGNVVITDEDDVKGHLERFATLYAHSVGGAELERILDEIDDECRDRFGEV
ncbi:hypothetical protein GCM10022243_55590 [Saccharothrix violaceirubra]